MLTPPPLPSSDDTQPMKVIANILADALLSLDMAAQMERNLVKAVPTIPGMLLLVYNFIIIILR